MGYLKNIFIPFTYWIWLSTSCSTVLFIWMIIYRKQNLITLINTSFFITVTYMMIFLYLFLVKGKFFDGVIYSFRTLHGNLVKKHPTIGEHHEKLLPSETFSETVYSIAKQQFFSMACILFILQGIYFVL